MNQVPLINRLPEQTLFKQVLSREAPSRILLVSGMAGMGKTSLLMQFREICQGQAIPNIFLHLYQIRLMDFSAALAEVADALGRDKFPQYQQQIETLTGLEPWDVPGENQVPLALGGLDLENRRFYRALITDGFFTDLSALTETQPVVMFFDDFEAMGPELQHWFVHIFLERAAAVKNAIVVVAGRQLPDLPQGWQAMIHRFDLAGIPFDEWLAFAQRKNLLLPAETAQRVLAISQGNPSIMAMYLSTLENQGA